MMYYIVNIYSDFIRQKRKITNLNESAYNKVISNTKLISEKKNIKIISLGFGKQKNGNFFYREIIIFLCVYIGFLWRNNNISVFI